MASMIESVKARRRGAQDFEGYYSQLCALQDTCPLSAVRAHLDDGVLDLNADRVRQPDWMPILNALRINRSLQFIAFRSYFEQNGTQEESRSRSQTQIRRPPPIRLRDITHRLSLALRECLSGSEQLHHLELQGLLLREKNVISLCKGLAKTKCLQHLSLEYCRIGDAGVECLCQCIKNIPTIVSLNLTATGLTSKSADMLAKLIKHQATRRHTEAWKDSLRYRRPDLDRMPGIRRITINNNPLVNDKGALALAEALKDDLWLKALDMQHCGLSNVGAKAFLDTLHQNTSLIVLDVRKNHLIDRDLLKAVIEQVMINSGGQELEYKWLRARNPKETPSKTRRRSRTSSASIQKGTGSRTISKKGFSQKAERRARSKSASGISMHTTTSSRSDFHPAVTRPGPGFVPWRTAARADQRSKGTLLHDPGSPNNSSTPSRLAGSSIHVHVGSSEHSSELETSIKDSIDASTGHTSTSRNNEESYKATISRKMKNLQVEAEELRRRLYIESRARSAADARIVELEVENSRLRHQVQILEARGPNSPLKAGKQNGLSAGENGADEALLDSIEESFRKFHTFLDILRDAGLGQLCTLVGLSAQDISHPLVKSILKNHQPSDMPGAPASSASGPGAVSSQPIALSLKPSTLYQQPVPYQPGNVMYPSQPVHMQPAQVQTGQASQPFSGMVDQGIPQMTGAAPVGFEGLHPAHFSQQTVPGGYPSTAGYGQPGYNFMAYPPGGVPMYAGQAHQQRAPPPVPTSYPNSQQTVLPTPPLVHQQPTTDIPTTTQPTATTEIPSSAAYSQQLVQDSVIRSSSPPASHVKKTNTISLSSPSMVLPPVSLSSTEGVFLPKDVQITSDPKPQSSSASGQISSSTSASTVRFQQEPQGTQDADDIAHQVDSRHGQAHPPLDLDSLSDQGFEPELQKASDSFDIDLENFRHIKELDFGESVESTPRNAGQEDEEDGSGKVESITPTKGMGSPTESDHSARGENGSGHERSHSLEYSDNFEGGGNDDDDSEVEEDLFQGSGGSLPGLTSDEDF